MGRGFPYQTAFPYPPSQLHRFSLLVNTTAGYLQCDGLTEKFNSTIVKMLSQYCDGIMTNPKMLSRL